MTRVGEEVEQEGFWSQHHELWVMGKRYWDKEEKQWRVKVIKLTWPEMRVSKSEMSTPADHPRQEQTHESMGCANGIVEEKMEWGKRKWVCEYQLDHMNWWCVILDALWFEHTCEMQDVQAWGLQMKHAFPNLWRYVNRRSDVRLVDSKKGLTS